VELLTSKCVVSTVKSVSSVVPSSPLEVLAAEVLAEEVLAAEVRTAEVLTAEVAALLEVPVTSTSKHVVYSSPPDEASLLKTQYQIKEYTPGLVLAGMVNFP
jgi:hypothetical protein